MPKKNKIYYVAINLKDFDVRLCSDKTTLASIIGIHRNTLSRLKDREVYNGFLIIVCNCE